TVVVEVAQHLVGERVGIVVSGVEPLADESRRGGHGGSHGKAPFSGCLSSDRGVDRERAVVAVGPGGLTVSARFCEILRGDPVVLEEGHALVGEVLGEQLGELVGGGIGALVGMRLHVHLDVEAQSGAFSHGRKHTQVVGGQRDLPGGSGSIDPAAAGEEPGGQQGLGQPVVLRPVLDDHRLGVGPVIAPVDGAYLLVTFDGIDEDERARLGIVEKVSGEDDRVIRITQAQLDWVAVQLSFGHGHHSSSWSSSSSTASSRAVEMSLMSSTAWYGVWRRPAMTMSPSSEMTSMGSHTAGGGVVVSSTRASSIIEVMTSAMPRVNPSGFGRVLI